MVEFRRIPKLPLKPRLTENDPFLKPGALSCRGTIRTLRLFDDGKAFNRPEYGHDVAVAHRARNLSRTCERSDNGNLIQ